MPSTSAKGKRKGAGRDKAKHVNVFGPAPRPTRTDIEGMRKLLEGRALRRWLDPLEPDRFFFGAVPRSRTATADLIRNCQEVFRQTHEFMEGWVVLSGQYRLEIEGTFAMMKRGDCLILPAGTGHAHHARPKDACTVLGWALFPLSLAVYFSRRGRPSTHLASGGRHLLPRSELPEAAVAEQLPDRARHWPTARIAAHAGQCLSMLFTAAGTLLEERSGWGRGAMGEGDMRVEAVTELIDKRYYQDLSLDQIARSVGLTPAYCCDIFSRTKKMSPMAYLSKVRLDAAATLLATTDLLVKQIAARAGFRDANYFTRRFRHMFGVTPLAYRRSVHAGGA